MDFHDLALGNRAARGVCAVLMMFPALAQGSLDWYPVPVAHRPPERWGFDMAYDSLRGVTVLFAGGTTGNEDTWEFDGSDWSQRFPAVHPPGRSYHAMAYDAARDRVVLFGGISWTGQGERLQDTWEWDGSLWSERTPAHAPPGRGDHRMVYDAARQRIVMYGGWDLHALFDTWEWDGSDWLQRAPAHPPPVDGWFSMAYDVGRQRTVLFGVPRNPGTWEWDGNDWLQRTPATVPPPRSAAALAYDAGRGVVVLSGGTVGSNMLGDTWTWDGTDWQHVVTQHSPDIGGHTMVHDAARNRMLVFGGTRDFSDGIDETWALTQLMAPPSFTRFGIGCAGSTGAPALSGPDFLPFLGTTFDLDLRHLPATTFGFLMLGFSDTSCWHLLLPAELSSFLMPGCWLYTDIVEALPFPVANGQARCSLALPITPHFEGLRFFAQGLVYDPPANARGFVSSNAGAVVLGSWR